MKQSRSDLKSDTRSNLEEAINRHENPTGHTSLQTTQELNKHDKNSLMKIRMALNKDIENISDDNTQGGDLSASKIMDFAGDFPSADDFELNLPEEEGAQLQPSDLEDIGNIFDRIRLLNKKN